MGIFEAATLVLFGTTIICFAYAIKYARRLQGLERILAELVLEMMKAEEGVSSNIKVLKKDMH